MRSTLDFGHHNLEPGPTGAVGRLRLGPHLATQRALEALLSSQRASNDSMHSLQLRPDSSRGARKQLFSKGLRVFLEAG